MSKELLVSGIEKKKWMKSFLELQEKHKDKIATPRLRLWARMIICSGIHDSTDTPPNIPAFAFAGRYNSTNHM